MELLRRIDEALKDALMKLLMPRVAGRADGKLVNEMARIKLSP